MASQSIQKLEALGIEAFCERIADGEDLTNIAKEMDVSRATVRYWIDGDNERTAMYAHAREERAHKFAEEIIAIADDATGDTITDDDGNVRTDAERVARSKLRVDARKWVAAKLMPKVYGDRLEVDNKVSLQDQTDEQLVARIARLTAATAAA